MPGQDFLSLGVDVQGFNAQKQALLSSAIDMFDTLDAYSKKVYNPILGTGLAEFNTSISTTSKLLDELNDKLSSFTQSANTSNTATSSAAKGVKELTTEQAAAKVQIQETNKLLVEQAKAQNLLVQSRQNAKAAIKAQFDAETALANQQKSDSALIQKMIANEAKAEELLAKQQIRDSKEIAAIQAQQAKEFIAAKKEQEAATMSAIKAQQQEDLANKTLRDDYLLLTQTLKEQASAYSNLYINNRGNSPAANQALKDYQTTSATLTEIKSNLNSVKKPADDLSLAFSTQDANIKSIGHGLKGMYNQLRIIAYILPGVGVAGIFNVAFQAISKTIDSIVDFANSTNNLIDVETKLNETFLEQLSTLDKINSAYTKVVDLKNEAVINDEKELAAAKAYGTTQNDILNREIVIAQQKVTESENGIQYTQITDSQKRLADITVQINHLNNAVEQMNDPANKGRNLGYYDPKLRTFFQDSDEIQKRKKDLQSQFDLEEKNLLDLTGRYQKHYDDIKELSQKQLEYTKLLQDQERNKYISTNESEVEVEKSKQAEIFSNIQSTHREKLRVLKNEENEENRLAELRRIKVTGITESDSRRLGIPVNINRTSSPDEVIIAERKQQDESRKARDKFNADTLKENIDYYQKILKAQIGAQEAQIEEDEKNYEKVKNNLQASLNDRLNAYSKYIFDKTQKEELERKLALSAGKSGPNDKGTSLTPQEVVEINAKSDSQIAQNKADAEEEIYNIVYSYGEKQLKIVKENFESENNYSKQQLIDDLHDNNEKFKNRLESYKKYLKERDDIIEQDTKYELEKDIESQKKYIDELQQLNIKRIKDKADSEVALTSAQIGGNKFDIDKAQGSFNANSKLSLDTSKELASAINRLLDLLEKLEKLKPKPPDFKDWVKEFSKIEKALYENVKKFVDAGYQYRLDILEKNKAIIDEQYGYELSAIQKSSLTVKDKAALDIQVAEQKREYDKKAQADERRIKVEQATFDKKLAIAHIIFGTAAAIIEGVPPSPKSVAAGIIGGIELAAAIATPIPAFEKGTKDFKGGLAKYGEAGPEVVKEPYRSPYLVMTETISYLPKGTEIIPVKESPVFDTVKPVDDWDKFVWLAKQLKKNRPEPQRITNVIKIDLGFETYKKSILGNG